LNCQRVTARICSRTFAPMHGLALDPTQLLQRRYELRVHMSSAMRRTWIVIKTSKDVHQKARTRDAQGISQLSSQKAVLQICSAVTREPHQSSEFGHGDCVAWSLGMPDEHAPLLLSDCGRQALQCLPVFVSAYRPDSSGRRNCRCAVHG